MNTSEIDKLSMRKLKIALAGGLRGDDYKYALARYLKMVKERERARV